jgi:O-antigen/teichoic acid export membrane protein
MSVFSLPQFKELVDRLASVKNEMIWVMFGQTCAFIGGVVAIKVLTNAMGPKSYGQLALGMTIAGFINMFIYGPIAQVVLRFFSICRERDELYPYFIILKKMHKAAAVIILILAGLAAAVIAKFVDSEWALIILSAALFGVVGGVNASLVSLQNANMQRKIVALHQGADAFLRALFALIFLFIFGNRGYSALLGFVIGTLVITLSQGFFTLKHEDTSKWRQSKPARNQVQGKLFHEFYSYVFPFFIFAIFAGLSTYGDRWILQGLFGEKEVGIYTAIIQIANAPVALLIGIITQFMVPIIFERAGTMTNSMQAKKSEELLHRTIGVTVVFLIPIVLVAFYYGETIIRLLTSPDFAEYYQSLWIAVLGFSLFNIGQLLLLKGLKINQSSLYMWPKIVQAISFLGLVYFLAKDLSVLGAAIALLLSSLIYLICIIIVNKGLHMRVNACVS